jgi:NTE family protein
VLFGQPNFWYNRLLNPLLLPHLAPEQASYCDTAPMLETLRRRANFALINEGRVRLSLGVTRVTTGQLEFFDNTTQPVDKPIGPEHVLASGSLPPGFPPTRIEGQLYWDGGCVANTPVDIIFREREQRPDLLILVDLYCPEGPEPTSMEEVGYRAKQIQFADRTLNHIRHLSANHNLRTHMHQALQSGAQRSAAGQEIARQHVQRGMHILHLVYRPAPDQIASSEAEFSRASVRDRRQRGYNDMRAALAARPWARDIQQHPHEIVVHHVKNGAVCSERYLC